MKRKIFFAYSARDTVAARKMIENLNKQTTMEGISVMDPHLITFNERKKMGLLRHIGQKMKESDIVIVYVNSNKPSPLLANEILLAKNLRKPVYIFTNKQNIRLNTDFVSANATKVLRNTSNLLREMKKPSFANLLVDAEN